MCFKNLQAALRISNYKTLCPSDSELISAEVSVSIFFSWPIQVRVWVQIALKLVLNFLYNKLGDKPGRASSEEEHSLCKILLKGTVVRNSTYAGIFFKLEKQKCLTWNL